MATFRGQLVARTETCNYKFNSTWTLHDSIPNQVWQLATITLSYFGPCAHPIDNARGIRFLFGCDENVGPKPGSAQYEFLAQMVAAVPHDRTLRVVLVLPRTTGRIARSDIVQKRLVDMPGVDSVSTLAAPIQLFNLESVRAGFGKFEALSKVLDASAAGFIASPSISIEDITAELVQRLSMPWIMPSTQEQRSWTLVLVDGRYDLYAGEPVYSAARALGIDLIVVERPGHWIHDEPYRSWAKDVLTIDMTIDEGYSDRIVEAVRASGHHIDGIVTMYDPRAAAVGRAAEKLGVALAPSEAFEIATNKFRTSLLDGHAAHRVSSLAEAKDLVATGKATFPLIAKPVEGYLSEGVFLLKHIEDLDKAITEIVEVHGKDAVIEPYCDGPEVDANFVLADGEILFFEASDDFPCTADEGDGGNFSETAMVLPSALPPSELQTIKKSLHKRLLQLGLRDGIFHLEARMHHSTMEYVTVDGILDLHPRPTSIVNSNETVPPSAWLIEINPRPPGMMSTEATAITYGVDYVALSLLLAAGDRERAKILAQPFVQRHQFWSQICFIPTPKGGIYNTDDACAELKERCPDLIPHLSSTHSYFSKGEEIPDPIESGHLSWIAYYVVNSRVSRRHLMEVCDRVKRETRFEIV
ncbi:Hypothetical protein R9X50_00274900 [Acrodontium crateriforme]|uniref:ATP-grasp domain-containing protein n=1 Tax=Acrodontium crateriforme TaxID=150365 RepID=A0AAQ3M7L8_9PEZI|nr:Hypothetical protein R9X50_00274900 [Acrodontium crateriforme]